jgi:hypothetical protein
MNAAIEAEIFTLIEVDYYKNIFAGKNYSKDELFEMLCTTCVQLDERTPRRHNERNAGRRPYLLKNLAHYYLHQRTMNGAPQMKNAALQRLLEKFRKQKHEALLRTTPVEKMPKEYQEPVNRTTVSSYVKDYSKRLANDPYKLDWNYQWVEKNLLKHINL